MDVNSLANRTRPVRRALVDALIAAVVAEMQVEATPAGHRPPGLTGRDGVVTGGTVSPGRRAVRRRIATHARPRMT